MFGIIDSTKGVVLSTRFFYMICENSYLKI